MTLEFPLMHIFEHKQYRREPMTLFFSAFRNFRNTQQPRSGCLDEMLSTYWLHLRILIKYKRFRGGEGALMRKPNMMLPFKTLA